MTFQQKFSALIFCSLLLTLNSLGQAISNSTDPSEDKSSSRKNIIFSDVSPLLNVKNSTLSLSYRRQINSTYRLRAEVFHYLYEPQQGKAFYRYADTTLTNEYGNSVTNNIWASIGIEKSHFEKSVSFYYGVQLSYGYYNSFHHFNSLQKIPADAMNYIQMPAGSLLFLSTNKLVSGELKPMETDEFTYHSIGLTFPIGIRTAVGKRFELLAEIVPQAAYKFYSYQTQYVDGTSAHHQYPNHEISIRQLSFHLGYRI